MQVPDVLVSLHVETVEVVVLDQTLLVLLVLALPKPLHDGQLHLHGDVDRQDRLQEVLLLKKREKNDNRFFISSQSQ